MVFTLEDYLTELHSGQWFGFKNLNGDNSNKTYANLVIYSSDDKPSESECISGIKALQLAWDTKDYARKRRTEYDALNQDEMRYDDQINNTTTWVDAIKAIKDKYPKE